MSTDGTSTSAYPCPPPVFSRDSQRRGTCGDLPVDRSWYPIECAGEPSAALQSNFIPESAMYTDTGRTGQPSRRVRKTRRKCFGSVQVQICHDPKAKILYVTVLRARLSEDCNTEEPYQSQLDPYVIVYLLPNRTLDNQRRTRHLQMCNSPQWNQTMVYPDVDVVDLESKNLEVSAWNYKMSGDDELLGRVILPLSGSLIILA